MCIFFIHMSRKTWYMYAMLVLAASINIHKNLGYESVHEISNNVVCATTKASDQPAHTHSLIRALASSLSIELLTEHH